MADYRNRNGEYRKVLIDLKKKNVPKTTTSPGAFPFIFHKYYSPFSANSIKYDLINSSILPSITPFTSLVW